MGLDLSLDEGQRLIVSQVSRLCRACCGEAAVKAAAGRFPRAQWDALGEAGFLALGAVGGEGGVRELVVAVEALGRAVFPGPLLDAVLGAQVLDAETRQGVIRGELVVSSGRGGLMPYALDADVFLLIGRGEVRRAEPRGPVEPVETLGGEPWGRVSLQPLARCHNGARGLAVVDVALSAYLVGAAQGLLHACAEHAATRRQFGRPLGAFQAVAHPLADCHVALAAARTLARQAACALDDAHRGAPRPASLAAAARLSSQRAALQTAYFCHQKFGAIGVTLEGPAHHVTRRIRQLVARPPEPADRSEAVLAYYGDRV